VEIPEGVFPEKYRNQVIWKTPQKIYEPKNC